MPWFRRRTKKQPADNASPAARPGLSPEHEAELRRRLHEANPKLAAEVERGDARRRERETIHLDADNDTRNRQRPTWALPEPEPLHAHEVTEQDLAFMQAMSDANISDDSHFSLPNGKTITGAELRQWNNAPPPRNIPRKPAKPAHRTRSTTATTSSDQLRHHEEYSRLVSNLESDNPFIRERTLAGLQDLAHRDSSWADAVNDILAAAKRDNEREAITALQPQCGDHRATAAAEQRHRDDAIIAETRRRIAARGISFGTTFTAHAHGCDACGCDTPTVAAYNGGQPIWRLCRDCLAEAKNSVPPEHQ